jgi:glucose/arabinose dehydrogenase
MRSAIIVLGLLVGCMASRPVESAKLNIDLNRPISGYALTAAFPGVSFNQPVGIASPPGETNRLFIIEREGVVCVITNLAQPSRTVFLDLRDRTLANYIEAGLLGLAFHPNYKSNGYFFVFRTVRDGSFKDRLSRFRVSADDPNRADPVETVLIDQEDVRDTHNAGDLHFGPDGYLYLSIGDESPPAADRRSTPQAIDGGLFGGIIRIDVDQRLGNLAPNAHPSVRGNYSIPADNPFIGATSFLGSPVNPSQVRTEFYAVGMRNPWRFTFDSLTGELVASDVGHGALEEINLIARGGNYGWPYWEGSYPQVEAPPGVNAIEPLYEYGRGKGLMHGNCIIGGVICRNIAIPYLEGWYVFADEGSGNIWKIRTDDPDSVQWVARESHLSSFGRDPATGDLLATSLGRGEIRRLVYVAPELALVPLQLSQTGIFTNLTTLAPSGGLMPFDVNVPFWSDGAIKTRWFGLMDPSKKIGFSAAENWTFPNGAVWVKHFELETEKGNPASSRRIETRLLVKSREEFYGFTYRWNTNGTDAQLVDSSGLEEAFTIQEAGGVIRTQIWNFPARGDCNACHTKEGGGALGFNTAQLNLDRVRSGAPENQLQKLAAAGYLNASQLDPHNLPRLAKSKDEAEPLEFRVKSYLSANCSQCHQPGGVWGAWWDARWNTPMAESAIVNRDASLPLVIGDKIIAPHGLTNSVMYRRVTEPQFRMPPIGSTVLDDSARELLLDWIMAIPDERFKAFEIGAGTLRGSETQRGDLRLVSGIGAGMSGNADRLHLVGGNLKGAGHIVARISEVAGGPPGLTAGLMIRATTEPDSPAVWLARDSTGRLSLIGRTSEGTSANLATQRDSLGPWLRLLRKGSSVLALQSANATDWTEIGELEFDGNIEALAGAAVASGQDWRYATASFENIQLVSISLSSQDWFSDAELPRDIPLQASVETNGVVVTHVDFTADGYLLARMTNAPWMFVWTNAWAGDYEITATAYDQNGLAISSEPLIAHFKANAPIARFAAATNVTQNWRDLYGRFGMGIPAVVTNMPDRSSFAVVWGALEGYSHVNPLSGASEQLPAAAWGAGRSLWFRYRAGNEVSHRVTLFFAQYDNAAKLVVTFKDPQTGAVLDTQAVSGFASGSFLSWAVRGNVDIHIDAASAGFAHLEGVFLDPIPPINVRLQPMDQQFILPATILLKADASAEGRQIRRVEFWDGDTKIAEDATLPYEFAWTNAIAGEHSVRAWAVGELGLGVFSDPITIQCALPSASVTFVGEDRFTQGNWIGPYGNVGHVLLGGWTNMPSQLRATTVARPFVFSGWTDVRGSLQWGAASLGAFAGCYVVNSDQPLEIRVARLDGRPARLALYFQDWLGPGRAEKVELFDVATGKLLDQQSVTSFYDGAYLNWNVQGDLRAVIRSLNDYNTILNAIFFDPPESFASFWLRQRFPGSPESQAKWAADPDGDGRPNLLEYAAGSDPLNGDAPILPDAALNGDVFHVTASLGLAPSDARLVLETSSDLENWEDSGAILENGAYNIPYSLPASGSGGRYFRLRAELIGN